MAGLTGPASQKTNTVLNSRAFIPKAGEFVRREILLRQAKLREASELPESAYKAEHEQYRRNWVSAGPVPMTTVATRRERFRIMQWNVLTDSYTKHKIKWREEEEEDSYFYTTPFSTVCPRLPDEDMRWSRRCPMIVDEILTYDPDVVMINELNKQHFDKSMWRMMRSNGYGCFYTSSRLKKAATKTQHEDPVVGHHFGRIPYEEDVGNAIFYHKGRFTATAVPGYDGIPKRIPYFNLSGLTDRVTGMCLLACTVHFTAGHTKKAVEARETEARGLLKFIKHWNTNNLSRSHNGLLIAGDFNNVSFDEPCVALMNEAKLVSAYDLVGGPAWTSWYHTDKETPWVDQRHGDTTWERRNTFRQVFENKPIIAGVRRRMVERLQEKRSLQAAHSEFERSIKMQSQELAKKKAMKTTETQSSNADHSSVIDDIEDVELKREMAQMECGDVNKPRGDTEIMVKQQESTALEEILNGGDKNVPMKTPAVRKMLSDGIVKRTNHFMFFDPGRLSVTSVLDMPKDEDILADGKKEGLLPSHKCPSHQIPLVAEFAWNTFDPELKEPQN